MTLNTIGTPNLVLPGSEESQEQSDYWTTAQAAQALNRPERSVRRLVQNGSIKGFKVRGKFGEEWRIIPFPTDTEKNESNSSECTNNDLCFDVPDQKQIDSNNDVECDDTTEEICSVARVEVLESKQTAPSAWNSIFCYLKSLLLWLSKGEKTSRVIDY